MLSCLEAKLEILFGLLSLTKGCRYFCFQLAKRLRAHCQALVGNRLGFRGVLTQAQEGSLCQAVLLEEPADGCHGQARAVGSVLGRDKKGGMWGGTGRNSPPQFSESDQITAGMKGGGSGAAPGLCPALQGDPAPLLSITPQH